MKGMRLCKQGSPDIQPAIAFLGTRSQAPYENDWSERIRLLKYLQDMPDEVLILEANNTKTIPCYMHAKFSVHRICPKFC